MVSFRTFCKSKDGPPPQYEGWDLWLRSFLWALGQMGTSPQWVNPSVGDIKSLIEAHPFETVVGAANSAGLVRDFKKSNQQITFIYQDFSATGASATVIPMTITPQRVMADTKPDNLLTPSAAYTMAQMARQNSDMWAEGVEIEDGGTAYEKALLLHALTRAGISVRNKKDVEAVLSQNPEDKAQAGDDWKKVIAENNQLLAIESTNETALSSKSAGAIKEDFLSAKNLGESLLEAKLINRDLYDARGTAQAKLVAIREKYKAGIITDQQLADLGVGFKDKQDRGQTVKGMIPFLEKFDEIDSIMTRLGITDTDIQAAVTYLDEAGPDDRKLGANRAGETHQVPFMGEITNIAFPDFARKEQLMLIVQQSVRALETLKGHVGQELAATYAADLSKPAPRSDIPELAKVWAAHHRINKGEADPQDVTLLIDSALKAISELTDTPDHSYRRMFEAYKKEFSNPQSACKNSL